MNKEKVCSFPNCKEPFFCNGYCRYHNKQHSEGRPLTERRKNTCSFLGCKEKHLSNGYCRYHYSQWYRGRPLTERPKKKSCSHEGCNEKHWAKGLCKKHYYAMYNSTGPRAEVLREVRKKYEKSEKGHQNKLKQGRKRRARKSNAPAIENFTYEEVFNRDGYTCCVCGLPIDARLKKPDLLRVSLEHKIPLSKNGSHTLENCAPSHMLCNLKKGARLLELNFEGASI